MDEVFGVKNFIAKIVYSKTSGQTTKVIATVNDYIIWYAKDKTKIKYRQLFKDKFEGSGISDYQFIELNDGSYRRLEDNDDFEKYSDKIFRISDLNSQGITNSPKEFEWNGKSIYREEVIIGL